MIAGDERKIPNLSRSTLVLDCNVLVLARALRRHANRGDHARPSNAPRVAAVVPGPAALLAPLGASDPIHFVDGKSLSAFTREIFCRLGCPCGRFGLDQRDLRSVAGLSGGVVESVDTRPTARCLR